MAILIKNGHVVDPDTDKDGIFDIFIDNGKITRVAKGDEMKKFISGKSFEEIDASGKYVLPGFIDLHVHFRTPGQTYKEDIKSGSMSAARGGFTTVCTMPNTKPVMDTVEHLNLQLDAIKKDAVINVLPIGAATMGQDGKEPSDIAGMKKAGIVAVSEDGKSVMNAAVLKKVLKIAAELDLPFFDHCEDINLVEGGVMNAGKKAAELGMPGITNAVEDSIAIRDIMLAKETGATLHLCHSSTKDSVDMVKRAKEQGLSISAEVCPHHFTLCDEDIPEDDANYKMNPPLRGREDMETLKNGIKDGIMEMIATDHAPHSEEEKKKSIKDAPFGIVGLETAFALTVTELLGKYLDMKGLVERMSLAPAKLLKIEKGTLKEGTAADIVIVDIYEEYEIDASKFASKGKNTPFNGKKVRGKVLYTICGGKTVFKED